MFWTIIIRTWKIYVFYENFDRSQESAVFHDHKIIDALTDMMSWVFIMIWLQNHVSIWQARLEIWYINITIIRFVCKFK